MKKTSFKIALALCCGAALTLAACKKNTLTSAPYDLATDNALFKVNYSSPYKNNPAIQIKIDGERVSNPITYSTPFPGGGLNTGGSSNADYLSMTPGEHTVAISIPKAGATSEDSIALYSTKVTVSGAKYYTLHITDTTANTQSVLMVDQSNKPDSGRVMYTFVNLIPSTTNIDLYFNTTKLASNIAYKQFTDTFSLAAGTSGQWSLRTAGSASTSTALYTYPSTAGTTTTVNQRVFTVYARGYLGLTSTDTRRAMVSLVFNK